MSVTIGTVTLDKLQAQPFGYEASDVKGGLTSRQWEIQGLVTGEEWADLIGVYDDWRDAKILEEPASVSRSVGTTIAFSGTGYGGEEWTNVACWFSGAPSGTQVGAFVSASFTLIDATQAVQVIVKEEVDSEAGTEGGINYGTFTLGGVVITLSKDPDVYLNTPTLELTAAGNHYVTGTLEAVRGKEVEGTIVGTDKLTLRNWYVATIEAAPVKGDWYPTTSPTFNPVYKLLAGVPTLHYEVTITVAKVK